MADPHRQLEFGPAVETWKSRLGSVRDAVRQELVARQLASHLPADGQGLWALDAGCGQGTQALALARAGYHVVGVDMSEELLAMARDAAGAEDPAIRDRLHFDYGDVLALGPAHAARYDVVCCHGVAMYLPTLEGLIAALAGTARPGGWISLLTRNQAGIAMRAGLSGAWAAALAGFDADRYTNRLGVDSVRADDPARVRAALAQSGATTVEWYGVRLFCDHWDVVPPAADFADLLAAEEEAGRRDPYRSVAALTHTIARTSRR